MNSQRVGDIDIAYDLRGRPGDPVIVLVSGLSRPHISFDDGLVERLAEEGFAVLRFDNRDCGKSTHFDDAPAFDFRRALGGDRSVVSYTLDDMADDTAGLVRALDLGPVHLAGASMGGMISQMAAVRHPELVRSLCSIMSTTGARDVGQATPEAQSQLQRRPPSERDAFIEHEMEGRRVVGSKAPWADAAWSTKMFSRMFDYGMYPPGTGRQLMAVLVSGDRTAALGSIAVPTLVIHGELDTLIAPSGGVATAAAIPGAELLMIPDMGHDLPPPLWPTVVEAIVTNARRGEQLSATAHSNGVAS